MSADSKCSQCIYRGNGGTLGRWCCEYILHTGKPRGCDPGEGCDKFVPGAPLGAKEKNYGLGPRTITRRNKMAKIDKEQLARMIAEGKTNKECAEKFGCTEKAVELARTKPEVREMILNYIKTDEPKEEAESVPEAESVLQYRTPEEKPATKTVAEYLAEEEEAERRKRETAEPDMSEPIECEPAPMLPNKPMPPLSRAEWEESRRADLARAICEYAVEGLAIDPAWVAEYNERVAQ